MEAVLRHMVYSPLSPQLPSGVPDSGDGALVRAARGGDRRGLPGHLGKIRIPGAAPGQAVFSGRAPDHLDVCQEAFMRVFKRLDELREPAALPGFIIGITLGVSRNEARRRRIRSIVGLTSPEELPGAYVPWRGGRGA